MKLNQGRPLFRYEIANFLNVHTKKLYRVLKKNKVPLQSGMVMPCDLDRIEPLFLGEKRLEEEENEDDKPENIP